MPIARPPALLPAGEQSGATRVNVFIHGYRAMTGVDAVATARRRVHASGVVGESYLLNWSAGGWSDSVRMTGATLAGLRAAYRVAKVRRIVSPWMILVDAGVVSLAEVAQFKRMERRAEQVGSHLMPLLASVAAGRPVNLIGHSLGARVVHHALMTKHAEVAIADCVLLGGAADLAASDWPDCLAKITGRLYNAYSPRDRILKITPDLRRRVGGRPMPQVVINSQEKVVNHRCDGVGHIEYWSRLATLLPSIWPGCRSGW